MTPSPASSELCRRLPRRIVRLLVRACSVRSNFSDSHQRAHCDWPPTFQLAAHPGNHSTARAFLPPFINRMCRRKSSPCFGSSMIQVRLILLASSRVASAVVMLSPSVTSQPVGANAAGSSAAGAQSSRPFGVPISRNATCPLSSHTASLMIGIPSGEMPSRNLSESLLNSCADDCTASASAQASPRTSARTHPRRAGLRG